MSQLSKPSLSNKSFIFDADEFRDKIPYRTVEMENGAILTAPSGEFDKVFEKRSKGNGLVEYATQGRVADQRIQKR